MGTPEERLNSLLQGELSAVETYDMALEKITTPATNKVLAECRNCHANRVEKLTQMVTSLGATPTTESGAWGAFAKLVAAGAVVLGEGPAVGALKEGEDQGLETYRGAAKHADDASSQFVVSDLLAAQENTQKAIANLYENMPAKAS
jgi:rubrerythrin